MTLRRITRKIIQRELSIQRARLDALLHEPLFLDATDDQRREVEKVESLIRHLEDFEVE